MATTLKRSKPHSKRRSKRLDVLQKPHGVIHPRVQKVGPEHFGIVSVDCAKARSKWMLTDFYGNVLIQPTEVEHNQIAIQSALDQIRAAMRTHTISDLIVAIERTGQYHHAVYRAFRHGGFDTRVVHPFTSKKYRQPSDPDNKTDDTDLAAIQRAAAGGFALVEPQLDQAERELQLVVRQRRDLVRKCAALQCQIREHLEAALPGYAACFDVLWKSPIALPLIRHAGSIEAIRALGHDGITKWMRENKIPFQQRIIDRVLAWAARAVVPELAAAKHHSIAMALDKDRMQKGLEIQDLERDLAGRLARSPYVFLLSMPGLNVVSAADCAAEIGPIQYYLNSRAITGRAGLYPSRYQSDRVDHPDGPLVRRGNRAIRTVLMNVADNLVACNRYFRTKAAGWKLNKCDPRLIRCRVAMRFTRIAFHMVSGHQVFRHPCTQERSYILQKYIAFHKEHETAMPQVLADLQAIADQLPSNARADEATVLADQLSSIRSNRRSREQAIGEILPAVLARLGVRAVQSEASGGGTPT